MTKNFKKVISTVAALAMAASSFVAMAATYPDVPADNNYYSAIEQASALGIIEGFDDGTFKPDEKVTRAQMAKIVVGAKNLLEEAEGNTRKIFDDVAPGKSEWAMGYVATASDYKIVNGTSATTFDPDASVTYMQAMKMLVAAAGYEDWAQDQGGWPEGYRYYGNQIKIGAGVTGVSDDTELTRGQVAQMLMNALKAPILDITGYERDNGEKYPIYKQMDGEDGRKFKSLLTEEWDVYEVYGRVTATSRAASNLKAGEVNYKVEKSENYDEVAYPYAVLVNGVSTAQYCDIAAADAADTGADDLLLEYSYALVNVNEDDEATIVYIESAGKNKVAEISGLLIDNSTTTDNQGNVTYDGVTDLQINVFKNENTNSTSKYKLAYTEVNNVVTPTAKIIVNGVEVDLTNTSLENAIETYAYGANSVTLVDSPQTGNASTDGLYDYIVVDHYATGVVTEVSEKATGEIKIAFDNRVDGETSLTIDYEDDDKTYAFVDTTGAEVDPATIPEYAILSIAYDVNEATDWNENSKFFNVIVSTDKVEGRIASRYTDNQSIDWFVVDGTDYRWVPGMTGALRAGYSYTLYLDKDGKIAKSQTLASAVNYAIVDRYFTSAGETKVRLILKDGTKADYYLADEAAELARGLFSQTAGTDTLELNEVVTLNASSATMFARRFVEYTVNKNDEVKLSTASYYSAGSNQKYNERASRVGDYGIAETSVLLDASAFAGDSSKSVAVTSVDSLIDELEYDVVVLGERDQSTATYPMIVLLTGGGEYTDATRMVVVASAVSTVEIDNVLKDQVAVVNGAEEVEYLTVDQGTQAQPSVLAGLNEGDAIIYKTDADGDVSAVDVIYSVANKTAATLLADSGLKFQLTSSNANGLDAGETVDFYLYPVIKRYDGSIAVAPIGSTLNGVAETATNASDIGKLYQYDIDAVAYQYDGTLKKNFVEQLTSVNQVTQSSIAKLAAVSTGRIDLTYGDNELAFAIIRVADKDVQEVYSIFFN